MTSPESPSSLLERAASFLEEQAKIADQGPWKVMMRVNTCAIHTGEGSPYPGDHLANVGNRYTAGWIATMSPSVATPLVAWLRAIAANLGKARIVALDARAVIPPEAQAAVDFARTVLGVPLEQEET